jgi:predicted ester cyclase
VEANVSNLEANKAIVRRYQEAYNSNRLELLDDVVAADIKTPEMVPGFEPGIEGLKQLHRVTIEAWTDFQTHIEAMIAEGNYVAVRVTCAATPQKEAFGLKPTGKSFRIAGMYIVHIDPESGKIVEHFGIEDALGIMQQLGAMPSPGGL